MSKIVLYIAMSLDGYIADRSGGVEWLGGDGSDPDNQGSYPEFYETVDVVILGYKTYHQIAAELFPDKWYYSGKKSYVLTHRKIESTDEIIFTDREPAKLLTELKENISGNIWICGGADIVNQLIKCDMIDTYCMSVIPTILGKGTSLFDKHDVERKLKLVSTRQYDGIVDLVYERR